MLTTSRTSWSRSLRLLAATQRRVASKASSLLPDDGLSLHDFVVRKSNANDPSSQPLDLPASNSPLTMKNNLQLFVDRPPSLFHIKTYGCQMNVNDTDIVRSLLLNAGFQETADESDASILLTNTCAIREGAEAKVWHRLKDLRGRFSGRKKRQEKIIGVLGCMAERLKEDLFKDGLADLVVGPDAYRDLPNLLSKLLMDEEDQAVNVQLSLDETYADITPVRRSSDLSAFVSIQRGCANRCSFCIVPFTRGQERSRPLESILQEIQDLHHKDGVKEVTLLGQNVNSYHDTRNSGAAVPRGYQMSNPGFKSRIRRDDDGYFFADLLAAVSDISPELRVRFTSPHPKDYPRHLLELMAERPNICQHLHMPAQSGATTTLKRMKRGYTREAYLQLIDDVHQMIPDVAISSDFIVGFCDETEDEFQETLSLMEQIRYDQAYMFAYSMREKTHAHRTMQDNVPEDVKLRRLREMIDLFHATVHQKNVELEVGRLRLVLVEGDSKRSQPGARKWHGRTDQNKRIVFPVDDDLPKCCSHELLFSSSGMITATAQGSPLVELKKGDYAVVEVTEAKGHSLRGRLLWKTSLSDFAKSGLSGVDIASVERANELRRQLLNENSKAENSTTSSATKQWI